MTATGDGGRKPALKHVGSDPGKQRGGVADESDIQPDQRPRSLKACRRCGLWRNATQPVPGAGLRRATIMLVGEQPGDKEDLAGEPFVGPAGLLLDKAIAQAGLRRDAVYVTNAVKHFKWELRGKRRMHKSPAQVEIAACSYWLDKELASIQPRVIVALGATALGAVLQGGKRSLRESLGQVFTRGNAKVVAAYHPSYALRSPDPQSRHAAFETIVDALSTARKLAGEG